MSKTKAAPTTSWSDILGSSSGKMKSFSSWDDDWKVGGTWSGEGRGYSSYKDRWPEQLRTARLRLSLSRWYLGKILWDLEPVAGFPLETIAIDANLRLFYHEKALTKWSAEELTAVLYHECLHFLRKHFERIEALGERLKTVGQSQSELFTLLATDLEINDDIQDEGLTLPEGCQFPKLYGLDNGLTFEQYYEQLAASSQSGEGDGDQEGGWGCGYALTSSGDEGTQQGLEDLAEKAGVGKLAPGEADYIRNETARKILRADGREDPANPTTGADWGSQINRGSYETNGQGIGDTPGGLVRWAEQRLRSQFDWRRELDHILGDVMSAQAGMSDYSYRRPSRRQSACPRVIFPTMVDLQPRGVIVVDTSGSMSGEQLGRATDECVSIAELYGETTVLAYDTRLQSRTILRAGDGRLAIPGGGGTDMSQAILCAAGEEPRPNFILVLTDGITGWPRESVGVPVIVGMIPSSGSGAYYQSEYWNQIPGEYRKLAISEQKGG